MLARIIAAAIAVVCLSAATVASPIPPPLSAVVQIDGNCTGFHIGGGRIVTAGHCIGKLAGFKVAVEGGATYAGTLAMYSSHRFADDLAVIRVPELANVAALQVSCGASPPAGTDVHMSGYPGVYGLATVWGKVAGLPRGYAAIGAWRDALPVNISSYGGFSGSPMMTEDGKVIGVLVGHVREAHTLAMAVPAYRLCEMVGQDWV